MSATDEATSGGTLTSTCHFTTAPGMFAMKYMVGSAVLVLVLAGCSALVPPQAWEVASAATPAVADPRDAVEQRHALQVEARASEVHADCHCS